MADFEGQIVVEPEPQMFDVGHEVGRDKDVDWRFGIGEGDECFLEDGLDSWQGSPFLHHQFIDGWAWVRRLDGRRCVNDTVFLGREDSPFW